jgi:glycosyltransferase involved in cell wall biosynthesis
MPSDTPAPVSVIMPAYNAAGSIERAIRSVLAQTRRPAELVIVDDGSTDGTADIVRGLEAEIAPVRLILAEQPNSGAGAARNHAVRLATQPFLAFLDADDQWRAEKIEKGLDAFDAPEICLVCTDFDLVTPDGDSIRLRSSRRLGDPANHLRDQFLYGSVGTSTVIARREAVLAAGGFDVSLRAAQDYDLWIEMLGAPDARLKVLEDPLTVYTGGHSGITGNVARRRDCSMLSLYRQAWRLRRRAPLTAWLDVVKRTVIVHLQAIAAHREKKETMSIPGDLVLMLLRLPLALIRLYVPMVRLRPLDRETVHAG